jgi:hypothetical protein
MLLAYQRYGRRPVNADAYVNDMATLARALGVIDPPTTASDLTETIDSFRDEVGGGAQAQSVASFLRFPGRALPIGAWAPYEVLTRAASDLLPDWAHSCLGTRARPAPVRAADAAVCTATLRSLEAVLGPRSRAVELAMRRVGVTDEVAP